METLKVRERDRLGKQAAKAFRRQGLVPCVFYGGGKPTRHLVADAGELAAVLRHGERVVELELEGEGRHTAYVKEVQLETLTEEVLHVDFLEVRMDQEITVSVPVVLRGSARGEHRGGMVEQIAHELEVTCLPGAVPEEIVVRIDELDVDDIWHVGDLPAPEGFRYASPPDTVVVTCHMPRGMEAEEEEAAEVVEPVRVEKEPSEEEKLEEAGEGD